MAEKLPFSQRAEIKPVISTLQLDSMSDDLRSSLWNALELFVWTQLGQYTEERPFISSCLKGDVFFEILWVHYFKQPSYTLHPN
jgi:hypothetical protein